MKKRFSEADHRHVLPQKGFVAVLPASHRLKGKRKIAARDLAHEPFVMGVASWSVFLQAVDQYCAHAGFQPTVVQTAHHSDGIVNFVAAGIGVSIYVDRSWLHRRDDIVVHPLSGTIPSFRSLAVWHKGTTSASLRNLLGIMRETLSQSSAPPHRAERAAASAMGASGRGRSSGVR